MKTPNDICHCPICCTQEVNHQGSVQEGCFVCFDVVKLLRFVCIIEVNNRVEFILVMFASLSVNQVYGGGGGASIQEPKPALRQQRIDEGF